MAAASVFLVAGARPNFVKVAPMYRALEASAAFDVTLVHTGQHYDERLSESFFRDLDLPPPDVHLEVGSGSHAQQTARVLERFEEQLQERQPDLVIVVGDVNSTIACSIATAKMVYPDGRRPRVAHVEAGLRSFDRTMPEEINRLLTDSISDYLFITEPSAEENLRREGVPAAKVFFVGNVMIDTLLNQVERAAALAAWTDLGLEERQYGVVTLHRPSNVDDAESLAAILDVLLEAAERLPLVFPVHPRTAHRLREFALEQQASGPGRRLRLLEPLGYLEFLSLLSRARVVLTDSDGIQEETPILGIPCITLRDNTERPVTITEGTNRLVGTDRTKILAGVDAALAADAGIAARPRLWDGQAAGRIVAALEAAFAKTPETVAKA